MMMVIKNLNREGPKLLTPNYLDENLGHKLFYDDNGFEKHYKVENNGLRIIAAGIYPYDYRDGFWEDQYSSSWTLKVFEYNGIITVEEYKDNKVKGSFEVVSSPVILNVNLVNDTLKVKFKDAKYSKDWIGFYKKEFTPGEDSVEEAGGQWFYLNNTLTAPNDVISEGELTFDMSGIDDGEYFVYFQHNDTSVDWYHKYKFSK